MQTTLMDGGGDFLKYYIPIPHYLTQYHVSDWLIAGQII